MKRSTKKALSSALICMLISLIPISSASAAEAWPNEGGHWIYGAISPQAYSNYYHANRCHGSTVAASNKRLRTVDIAPGKWAEAHIWWYEGTAQYYYRVC